MHDPRDSSSAVRPQDAVSRIRSEFTEMPGMRLTFAQVRRLSSLSDAECGRVLGRLVDEGVLTQRSDDRFCRRER